jgi:putative nucleotidyltransferase with HDIG domain
MTGKIQHAGAGRCGPGKPLRLRGACPSPATCRRLLAAHDVPDHIRRHSVQVARVARRIAEQLRERGEPVDVALVEAAALLHDIAKAPCLKSRLDHAAEGGRVLRELGLDAVAALVERHVHLGDWDPRGPVTAAELVNYADKRVLYEDVVGLEERFRDLIARYGRGQREFEQRIRRNWATMEAVEAKIFGRLPIGPADILAPGSRGRRGARP